MEKLPNTQILKQMEKEVLTLLQSVKSAVNKTLESLRNFQVDGSSFDNIKKNWE